MGVVKKVNATIRHLAKLEEAGYSVPKGAYETLQEKLLAATGLKQIWVCEQPECSEWKLELFVRASGTTCMLGHEAVILWESPKEQEDSNVGSRLDRPTSLQSLYPQENTQPLQNISDIFASLNFSRESSQKKIDD